MHRLVRAGAGTRPATAGVTIPSGARRRLRGLLERQSPAAARGQASRAGCTRWLLWVCNPRPRTAAPRPRDGREPSPDPAAVIAGLVELGQPAVRERVAPTGALLEPVHRLGAIRFDPDAVPVEASDVPCPRLQPRQFHADTGDAQDVRTGNPGPQQPGIRGMSVKRSFVNPSLNLFQSVNSLTPFGRSVNYTIRGGRRRPSIGIAD